MNLNLKGGPGVQADTGRQGIRHARASSDSDCVATQVASLQEHGQKLLTLFLNGGLGRHWYCYPGYLGCSKNLVRQSLELTRRWKAFAVSTRLPVRIPEAGHGVEMVLCEHYKNLAKVLQRACELQPPVYRMTVSQEPRSRYREHASVIALTAHITRYLPLVRSYWVHGSVGSGDAKPSWSDLDGLAVISSEAFSCPRNLRRVRRGLIGATRFLVDFFPLQLHGHFVVAEPDLAWFPEPFFPPQLFDDAHCVAAASPSLAIQARRDDGLSRKMLWEHGIQDLLEGPDHHLRDTLTKVLLLHRAYLLPCLVFQAVGQPCFKRTAFEKLDAVFEQPEIAALHRASEVWRHWKAPSLSTHRKVQLARVCRFNPILYYLTSQRLGRRSDWFHNMGEIEWTGIANDMQRTARSVWRRFDDSSTSWGKRHS